MILYSPLASQQKERFKVQHPRGNEIVASIEWELSRDPLSRATMVDQNRYALVYVLDIEPSVEVRVSFLAGDKVLVKAFLWRML